MRGPPAFRVGPYLFLRFIPSVIEQPRLGIPGSTLHKQKLVSYLVEQFRPVIGFGILGQKWRRHIEPIQPHLKRVYFLCQNPPSVVLGWLISWAASVWEAFS